MATIARFPGYTFYRDGTVKNRLGQNVGKKSLDAYIEVTPKDNNGIRCSGLAHRLVYEAFNGPIPDGHDIDHINGNPSDNRLENLQCLNRQDHCYKTHADNPRPIGTIKGRAVKRISDDGTETDFISITAASLTYGDDKDYGTSIRNAINNDRKYKGYKWVYIDEYDIPGEVWKNVPVDGLDEKIKVSNKGRVQLVNGKRTYGDKGKRGYMSTSVVVHEKKKTVKVHTYVCMAFHGENPYDKPSVDHLDGNKSNNVAENLEWSTPNKQARSWRRKVIIKTRNDIVVHIAKSITDAAQFLKVSVTTVRNYINGKRKSELCEGYKLERGVNPPEIKPRAKRGPVNENGGVSIYQLDDDKQIIKEFPTISSAIREMNGGDLKNNRSITTALIMGYKAFNFYWRHKYPPPDLEEKRNNMKKQQKEKSARYYAKKKNPS